MRVTVLGCGHSGGTPLVGKGWGKCDPDNPRNRRLRPSILVEDAGTQILVDTSPDLRQQLLNSGTERLDAVLYTHAHGDHLHGIDDLRAINRAMNLPIATYADAATWEVISTRFAYVLDHETKGANPYYKPALTVHEIAPGDAFDVGGVHITAFDQDHGFMRTIGYRLGAMAYSTDVVELPEIGIPGLGGRRGVVYRRPGGRAPSHPCPRGQGLGLDRQGEAETGRPHAPRPSAGLRALE